MMTTDVLMDLYFFLGCDEEQGVLSKYSMLRSTAKKQTKKQ